jgi:hypothetical protein
LISYFFQEIGIIEWLLIRTHLNVKHPGIAIWRQGLELYGNPGQAFDEVQTVSSPWQWLEVSCQSIYAPEFGTKGV